MTIAEIATEVEFMVNRSGLSVVATRLEGYVQAEVTWWAEQATWPVPKPVEGKVPGPSRRGSLYDWTFLRTSQSISATDGLAYYSLPAAFRRPRRLHLSIAGAEPLELLDLDMAQLRYYDAAEGQPLSYAIAYSENGTTAPVVWLFPTPEQSYTLTMFYTKAMTALAATESNIFTVRWPQGIKHGAVARAIGDLKQFADAQEFLERKYELLDAAIREDMRAEAELPMTMGVSTIAGGDAEDGRPVTNDGAAPMRKIDPAAWV